LKIAISHWLSQSPLTLGWRYRATAQPVIVVCHVIRIVTCVIHLLLEWVNLADLNLALNLWQVVTEEAWSGSRYPFAVFDPLLSLYHWWSHAVQIWQILMFITACSELRKVLFLAQSVCGFLLCMKYLGNCWVDLRQIHMEVVFGPSLGRVWRSKFKVTRDKKTSFFGPFGCLHAVCVWQYIFSL